MNVVVEVVPQPSRATVYAGVVTRAVAIAMDIALVQLILFVIGVVAGLIIEAFGSLDVNGDIETILGAAAVWLVAFDVYCTAFWALTGQTPGMRTLGIEVTTLVGERLSVRRSQVRLVGMFLAALPLFAGYALILLRDDRRGLHDLLAGSVVRYAERKRPPPTRGRRA